MLHLYGGYMHPSNDNFESEEDFLLSKAHEIIVKSKIGHKCAPCALTTGGECPLVSNLILQIHKFRK